MSVTTYALSWFGAALRHAVWRMRTSGWRVFVFLIASHSIHAVAAEVTFFDVRTGRSMDHTTLVASLIGADVILLGERHDDPEHQRVHEWIIESLIGHGRRPALYLEMLSEREERRYVQTMGEIEAGKIDRHAEHDALREEALEWSGRGWPNWQAYAPLFDLADRYALPVRHADLPDGLSRNIRMYGVLAIPRSLRVQLFSVEREKELEAMAGLLQPVLDTVHEPDPAAPSVAGFVLAQLSRDAYMAWRLSQVSGTAILIAGREHVRRDVGVPRHLLSLAPELKVLSMAPLDSKESVAEGNRPLRLVQTEGLPFDVVWLPTL